MKKWIYFNVLTLNIQLINVSAPTLFARFCFQHVFPTRRPKKLSEKKI